MKLPALALTAALALGATTAGAQEAAQDELPQRYPPSSVRPKLIAGGILVTGVAYGAGFLAASTWPDAPGASELKIPVVGPWMALANNGCAADDPGCGFPLYFRGILTAIGGLVQLGGLAIVGEGIFMTTEARPQPRAARSQAITVMPVPMVTGQSGGFGVVGQF
ncbi:MAG TPA: hypothetical protein VLS89_13360 [Candidatus Nanopelagicales bacterium]|nr:hypothetical protein [Candidatus Nanopelagicales bacterium]